MAIARSGSARERSYVVVGGLAILAIGMLIVRNGDVPDPEEWLFRRINDLPGFLYPLLWPLQQLGALVVGPIVAIVALVLRRYRLAAALLIVTAAKLASERVVKAPSPASARGPRSAATSRHAATSASPVRASCPATPSSSPPWPVSSRHTSRRAGGRCHGWSSVW